MRACLALLTVLGLGAPISFAQDGGAIGTAYTCVARLRPYVPPGFEIMAVNNAAMMINHHKSGRTFYFQRDSAVEIMGSKTTHIDLGTLKQVLRPPSGEPKVQMQLAIEECGRTFNWMTDPMAKALLQKAKDEDEAAARRAKKLAELKAERQKLGNAKISLRKARQAREPATRQKEKAQVKNKKKAGKKSAQVKKKSEEQRNVKVKATQKNRALAGKYFEKKSKNERSVASQAGDKKSKSNKKKRQKKSTR